MSQRTLITKCSIAPHLKTLCCCVDGETAVRKLNLRSIYSYILDCIVISFITFKLNKTKWKNYLLYFLGELFRPTQRPLKHLQFEDRRIYTHRYIHIGTLWLDIEAQSRCCIFREVINDNWIMELWNLENFKNINVKCVSMCKLVWIK